MNATPIYKMTPRARPGRLGEKVYLAHVRWREDRPALRAAYADWYRKRFGAHSLPDSFFVGMPLSVRRVALESFLDHMARLGWCVENSGVVAEHFAAKKEAAPKTVQTIAYKDSGQ